MRLEDLDYDLPADRIAQHPTARREASRLLVVERASGRLSDSHFERLGEWLRPGDALALNETRVIPARLMRTKDRLATEDGSLEIEVTGAGDEGERLVRVTHGDLQATLAERGEMPLPPYLRRGAEPQDRERYQTVFARVDGAVAAPTAGLHFSGELLGKLEAIGIATARIVLHVGPGTFRPVTAADPRDHRMDEEWFEVDASAAATLNGARARGGRIVAVGTTAVRALESACDANDGALAAAGGWTRKYIHPPYAFRAVDAMVTNFHLPRTTLLLLVAAFAGVETTRRAYAHALDAGYRFYSYGDAMLIL